MNEKSKNILTVALSSAVIFGFFSASILSPDRLYSLSERRVLAQKPAASVESVLSGKYMSEFESHALDQFPLRDHFRAIKAYTSKYILHQKDNNGLYVINGNLSKLEYPLNTARVHSSTDKMREIYASCISGSDCSVYLSVIPDKNYFLAPLGNYPTMDYATLLKLIRDETDFAKYIDIFPLLSLDDYYKTDQHWKQESIHDVAQALVQNMGVHISADFEQHTLDVPFYGAYCGQAALKFEPDVIKYLTNDVLNDCLVTNYDTGKPVSSFVYDIEKASGKDPYDLFLSGSSALMTIENPNSSSDEELVIFRDSFGSSIAPLLVSGYFKITLIDLRYISSKDIPDYVNFGGQDVLFLYSTLILNNGISM